MSHRLFRVLACVALFSITPIDASNGYPLTRQIKPHPSQDLSSPVQSQITKIAQVNPLYGCWQLTYSPGGIVHEGYLRMNGYSGTMLTRYYNPRTRRPESVQQRMQLGNSAQGLVILGTNPVYPGTFYRHPTYNADSFFFQIRPNGRYLFSVYDTAGVMAPVEVTGC